VSLFPDPKARTRAMAIYGSLYALGGGIGELLGGVITQLLSWRWIFLINLPIGAAVYGSSVVFFPKEKRTPQQRRHLDTFGAMAITGALSLLVYALVNGNELGWRSTRIDCALIAAGVLLMVFVWVEWRSPEPLMPLHLFRHRHFAAMNTTAILWSSGTFAWFVITALYLQRILGYTPLQVGLSFLPAEILSAVFSIGLSSRVVSRFGVRLPLVSGLLLATAGLAFFSRSPLQSVFATDVLPGMLLLGLGAGMASAPLLVAATSDLNSHDSGVVSGIVNTSFMIGGALGLAVLASVAALRTAELQQAGFAATLALNGGYRVAFQIGSLLTFTGALISLLGLRAED
jgi:predicted MFS family arabinose efflux permease